MASVVSKLTAQGQISIPAEVRRKLGLSAGSSIEWVENENGFQVKRAGKYTIEDLRQVFFKEGVPPHKTDEELKEGISDYVKEQHARGRY